MTESFTPATAAVYGFPRIGRPPTNAFHILSLWPVYFSSFRRPSSHVNVLFILDFPRTNVFTRSITAAAAGCEGRLLTVSYLVLNASSRSRQQPHYTVTILEHEF